MAPPTHLYAVYTYEEAAAIEQARRYPRATGDYPGWEDVATGNPVYFNHHRNESVGKPPKVKPSVRHPKMVDRSDDWKKAGRK